MVRPHETKFVDLPVNSIVDRSNVRHHPGDIESLALSVKTLGLLNPLIVVQQGNEFLLLGGQRRFLAIKTLGYQTVKCQVAENLSKAATLLWAVTDNSQRKQMSCADLADAAMKLEELTGKPDAHIAKLLGISPSILSQARSAMAALNDETKAVLAAAKASMFIYFAIRKLPDALQASTAKQAVDEHWNREQLQAFVKDNTRRPGFRLRLYIPADSYEAADTTLAGYRKRLADFKRQGIDIKDARRLL